MAWSPFKFDCFDDIDLPDLTTDCCPDTAMVIADEKEDGETDIFDTYKITKESSCAKKECGTKSVFDEVDDILAAEDDDEDDFEECGDNEICESDDEEDSPFEEAGDLLFEAVLDDGEDDSIADSVDDMPDDDDPAIDANAEGIDEIEQDILDDEEDDLIDAAMCGEDE